MHYVGTQYQSCCCNKKMLQNKMVQIREESISISCDSLEMGKWSRASVWFVRALRDFNAPPVSQDIALICMVTAGSMMPHPGFSLERRRGNGAWAVFLYGSNTRGAHHFCSILLVRTRSHGHNYLQGKLGNINSALGMRGTGRDTLLTRYNTL